jgi:AbrB family looped-hinge helix DNA binding protein
MAEEWSPTFAARVEAKYRVVIPPVVRRMLDLHEGDVVEVKVRKVGSWRILRG